MFNSKSDRNFEIDYRIEEGHKTCYKYKSNMRSKSISTNTKMKVNRAAVRLVVIFDTEKMNLTRKAKNV